MDDCKMRILVVSNIFPPQALGGYELGCNDICQLLHNEGNQVVVLTSTYFLGPVYEKFPVIRSLKLGILDEALPIIDYSISKYNLKIIDHYVSEFVPEIVIMFNLAGIGAPGIVKYIQLCKLPSILYLMDNVFSDSMRNKDFYANILKAIGGLDFTSSTSVISMSKRLVNEINEDRYVSIEKYNLVPGWASRFSPTRSLSSFNKKEFRFIFASRIAEHKGVSLLLNAVAMLVEEGVTNFTVDFYGDGELSHLVSSIKTKNISKYVNYCGSFAKDEMLKKYELYDSLIFPTWPREPFGFVVSEAMASGTPVMLTKGTGAHEWLNESACISFDHSPDSIANSIRYYINLSCEERFELSNKSAKFAHDIFNIDKCYKIIKDVINETVTSSDSTFKSRSWSSNKSALSVISNIFST